MSASRLYRIASAAYLSAELAGVLASIRQRYFRVRSEPQLTAFATDYNSKHPGSRGAYLSIGCSGGHDVKT